MYTFFDNHGKKLLAVLAAFLMLAFILPGGFNGRSGGPGRLGTLDGQRVDVADVQTAHQTLLSLDRLVVPARGPDGQSALVPAPQAVFGPALYRKLEQDPILLYLLMREAQKIGADPDARALEPYFNAPSRLRTDADPGHDVQMDRLNPEVKAALREDLRRLVSVVESFRRGQLVVKISRPLIDEALARSAQEIKARVVSFDATDYEKTVPGPTADDLQRQFDAYKDQPPVANDVNPYGFGYRVPDRVAIQWLVVPTAEAAKAVEASRHAEKWEEDAYFYYGKNQQEFASTQPSATPTTRPFDEVKADVLRRLRDPMIEQKKREVAGRIVQRLTALAAATQPAHGPLQRTDEPAYTFEALQSLADAVQKQTGVRPTVVAPAGLLSADDLAKQPGLGSAVLNDPVVGFKTAAEYVFESLKALHPTANADAPASASLEVGKPTPALSGVDGLYVARVVGYATAHPAESLDAIRADVERDVRRGRAFDMAADAAAALLAKAKAAGGLEKSGATVQTSGWFNAEDPAPAGLTGDWTNGVPGPAFDTLRGLSTSAALPTYTVAKLRKAGRAVIIEVFDVRTQLNTTIEPTARRQAEQTAAQGLVPPDFVPQWFALESVSRRVGYAPDLSPRPAGPAEPSAPTGPRSPFTPG